MRILFLVDNYLPSTKSSAKLIHDLASEMVGLGHEATVVAPDHTLRQRCRITEEQGITVVRVRSGRLKGSTKVMRVIKEWRLSAATWSAAREFLGSRAHDLVVFYSPTIFFGSLVRRLRKLWDCPAYLILRDIFPQWAVDSGLIREGSLSHRFFRRKELQQYASASVVAVQSPANLDYFRKGELAGRYQLDVLYNWTAMEEAPLDRSDFRKEHGLQDKIILFYGGNFGVAQDVYNLLRLAESLLDEQSTHFVFVGEGSEYPRMEALIRDRRLTNTTLLPAVGQREYRSMLREFDIGLISLQRELKTQNFPGKLLAYLFFGIPTLASINEGNDLTQILESSEAGVVVPNGEDDRLRRQALRLARDPELRGRMGRNGRSLLEQKFSAIQAARQVLTRVGRLDPESRP